MKSILLDANVILRFLRDDDAGQSPRSKALIVSAREKKIRLILTTVTLAEVFYALRSSYKMNRHATAEVLQSLLYTGLFQVDDPEILSDALDRVKNSNVDLGDALLAAKAAADNLMVATFDADFDKFDDVKLHDWQ